jgi:alpha-amylase/alpha-mannosidase (GH57 family)
MHQPYYRSARTGAFQMPWARLHALKDYLDMVEILADYPAIHQTFNLVPSLVEQLGDYAGGLAGGAGTKGPADAAGGAGGVTDIYWEHTLKPAAELTPEQRLFVVERMCERSDHPRAKSHPRYLQLAQKRDAMACRGWAACSEAFSVDELRDLQIWFTLAWFDPTFLETEPLLTLVVRGRDFREEDKSILARVQGEILGRVIPAYRDAARRSQIELSTSPYFHPILPLLINSDSARVGAADTVLPRRRFAHPEDAWEQVRSAVLSHESVFGAAPTGMWCSEQSVGEDVLPLLFRAGIAWTISDQTVLSRSLTGSAAGMGGSPTGGNATGGGTGRVTGGATGGAGAVPASELAPGSPYQPYLLRREAGEVAIIFRDHTLSDLIGFGYQSWDSRDAAIDLIGRIRAIGSSCAAGTEGPTGQAGLTGTAATGRGGTGSRPAGTGSRQVPLVTIALDGENAWEYYPRDGRDFLHYLYEGLAADPDIRCVSVSEHLREHPATVPLDWLHTGSWIGGDLRTWCGDPGHNTAWDLLHDARDLAASRGRRQPSPARDDPVVESPTTPAPEDGFVAWRHILVAEGSDWFWWFGEHHHTELDYVWDSEFRQHLQEVYRSLGEPVPIRLHMPVLMAAGETVSAPPATTIQPVVDGRLTDDDGWSGARPLVPDHPSTMQRADGMRIAEARFWWDSERLYLLLIPRDKADLQGLEIELQVTPADATGESEVSLALTEDGQVVAADSGPGPLLGAVTGAWEDVVEVAIPWARPFSGGRDEPALTVRVGREGMVDHLFRSGGTPGSGSSARSERPAGSGGPAWTGGRPGSDGPAQAGE